MMSACLDLKLECTEEDKGRLQKQPGTDHASPVDHHLASLEYVECTVSVPAEAAKLIFRPTLVCLRSCVGSELPPLQAQHLHTCMSFAS